MAVGVADIGVLLPSHSPSDIGYLETAFSPRATFEPSAWSKMATDMYVPPARQHATTVICIRTSVGMTKGAYVIVLRCVAMRQSRTNLGKAKVWKHIRVADS